MQKRKLGIGHIDRPKKNNPHAQTKAAKSKWLRIMPKGSGQNQLNFLPQAAQAEGDRRVEAYAFIIRHQLRDLGWNRERPQQGAAADKSGHKISVSAIRT